MTAGGPGTTGKARLPLAVLLSAYLISVTCTAVSALTLPWLVLTSTGSPTRTGLVVFAEMGPYVVMQALAGPWVERIGPRTASWVGNSLAGMTLLAIPLLHLAASLRFGRLVILAAVVGGLRGLADCGSAPLIPATARLADVPLERAAGLHSSVSQGGYLVGAPVAGLLLTLLEPALVLVVSGLGFLAASAFVAVGVPRKVGQPDSELKPSGRYRMQLAAGFAFSYRDPVLRGLLLMLCTTNLVTSALSGVLLPAWVSERGLPVASLGAVTGTLAAGGLAGSLLGAWLGPRVRRWLTFAVGFLLGGGPLFLTLALSSSLWPGVVAAGLCGLAAGGINPIIGAVQYERIPAAMLPRVLGAVKAGAWMGIPIGPLVGGLVTSGFGVTTALFGFGSVFLLITLVPFLVPAFRMMDERIGATGREPGGSPGPQTAGR